VKTVCLAVAAFVLVTAGVTPAAAGPVPAGARVRAARTVDVPTFARVVALRFHVTFNAILAADFDSDGDVDIIAATDREFVIWVNDGSGHLTSQTAPTHPLMNGTPGATIWNDGRGDREEPVQNDVPSSAVPREYAHAPPALVPAAPRSASSLPFDQRFQDSSAPRAPPATSEP